MIIGFNRNNKNKITEQFGKDTTKIVGKVILEISCNQGFFDSDFFFKIP